MRSRVRPKSSFESLPLSRRHSCQSIRPQSSLILALNPSIMSNGKQPLVQSQLSRSPSSIWRAVSAARCQKHLQKQTIEPIRKNLSEKKIRLEAKRVQQQKKYESIISTIRKKCEISSKLQREQFKDAHRVIEGWVQERGMEKNRYLARLLKLKR